MTPPTSTMANETYTTTDEELQEIYDKALSNITTKFKGDSEEVRLTREAYMRGLSDGLHAIWSRDRKIISTFNPAPLPGQSTWE